MSRNTQAELRALARQAAVAADELPHPSPQAERAYARLRDSAFALNERHEWASPEEFTAEFPSLEDLASIDTLNAHYRLGGDGRPSPAAATRDPIERLLLGLAGWATGVRLAGETLGPER